MAKKRYFKLGANAQSFSDTASGLVISGQQVVGISSDRVTKRVKDAVTNGHIKEVKEEDLKGVSKDLIKDAEGTPAPKEKEKAKASTKDEDKDEEEEEDEDDEEEDEDDEARIKAKAAAKKSSKKKAKK